MNETDGSYSLSPMLPALRFAAYAPRAMRKGCRVEDRPGRERWPGRVLEDHKVEVR